MHRRLAPRHHRFTYRVFAMLLDLDELAGLDKSLRFFKWNRFGIFSFHDRDHGPLDRLGPQEESRPLKAWLDGLLAASGITASGPRRVLCYPRIFGYVFNPLSVWFCHDGDGALKAVVYEVHNTYDERHAYVLPVAESTVPVSNVPEHRPGGARPQDSGETVNGPRNTGRPRDQIIRHGCAKDFYVSPFLSADCRYHFRVRPPDEKILIAIHEEEAGRPILNASFAGARRALGDASLFAMLLSYPLMTLKVVVAIHYEAVRLMLKGVRRHPHSPKSLPVPAE